MGISSRMTGTAWHIEKINGTSKKRKTCYNCIFLEEKWCSKNKIICTNNNANICNAFKNKFYITDSKKENLDSKKINNVQKQRNKIITERNTRTQTIKEKNISLFIYLKENNWNVITSELKNKKHFIVNAFLKVDFDSEKYYEFEFKEVIINFGHQFYRASVDCKGISVIQSGNYLTMTFTIYDMQKTCIGKSSYKYLYSGVDSIYGMFNFKRKR